MTEWILRAGALLAGVALGALFFGGLWWTIRRSLHAAHPALWFSGSLLVRSVAVLAGFYGVAGHDGARWLAAVCGFVLAQRLSLRHMRLAQTEHA